MIRGGSELYALVPDSSVVHTHDTRMDGRRLATACSQDHLSELVKQYRRRPFVAAELWAGKMARALGCHPGGIGAAELAAETGLTSQQIELASHWRSPGTTG